MQSETPVSSRPISFNPIHRLRRRVKNGSVSVFNNKYCNAITNAMGRYHNDRKKFNSDEDEDHSKGEEEELTRSNTPETLSSQKVKKSDSNGRPKSNKFITPNDSNVSLFSEANTLVGSGSINTEENGGSGGVPTNEGVNLSSSSSPSPTADSSSGNDSWTSDVKAFIKGFNHSVAYELGHYTHLHYYQLPFPYRENKYIIHGYRFYASHKKSFLSILNWYGWHNETSNIWSHLLGGIYLLYLAFYHFPHSNIWLSDRIPEPAKCVVLLFLAAAIKCMFASVFWHTFNGTHILRLRSRFACVDYTGITVLITASILTVEFVTMYDYKISLLLYMTCSLALGAIGVFMNWSPKFDRPEARPLRIKFFILLATVGCSSFVQLVFLTNWKYAAGLLTPLTNKSLVWYLIGVFFYGSFIPERFRTDVLTDRSIPTEQELSSDLNIVTKHKNLHFREIPTKHPRSECCTNHANSIKSLWWVDYIGCSHTLWHFFVLLGVIGHYNAVMDMFTKRWIL